jgi:probable HAF family extracellular repeat protein
MHLVNTGGMVKIFDIASLRKMARLWVVLASFPVGAKAHAGPILIWAENSVQTVATAINNAGQIVGYIQDSALNVRGFQYAGGLFTFFDAPGASDGVYGTVLTGINDLGAVIGYYYPSGAGGSPVGFVIDGSGFRHLTTVGGSLLPTSISNTGIITGYGSGVGGAQLGGFSYGGSGISYFFSPDLEPIYFTGGAADGGAITGYFNSRVSGAVGLIYSAGFAVPLDSISGATHLIPYDTNIRGEIVGDGHFGGEVRGFYSGTDSDLIFPLGWTPRSISDDGRIVGSYGFSGTNRAISFIMGVESLTNVSALPTPALTAYPLTLLASNEIAEPSTASLIIVVMAIYRVSRRHYYRQATFLRD